MVIRIEETILRVTRENFTLLSMMVSSRTDEEASRDEKENEGNIYIYIGEEIFSREKGCTLLVISATFVSSSYIITYISIKI